MNRWDLEDFILLITMVVAIAATVYGIYAVVGG